jgi:hypothetical protein
VVTNPVFVAEILSPSTEGLDRGGEVAGISCEQIATAVCVGFTGSAWVEIHTRDEAGFWRISETRGLEGECEFAGVDCRVPMAALYEGVLQQ